MVNSYSKCMKQKKIKKYGKNKNEDNLLKKKKKSIALVAKSFDMNSNFSCSLVTSAFSEFRLESESKCNILAVNDLELSLFKNMRTIFKLILNVFFDTGRYLLKHIKEDDKHKYTRERAITL